MGQCIVASDRHLHNFLFFPPIARRVLARTLPFAFFSLPVFAACVCCLCFLPVFSPCVCSLWVVSSPVVCKQKRKAVGGKWLWGDISAVTRVCPSNQKNPRLCCKLYLGYCFVIILIHQFRSCDRILSFSLATTVSLDCEIWKYVLHFDLVFVTPSLTFWFPCLVSGM